MTKPSEFDARLEQERRLISLRHDEPDDRPHDMGLLRPMIWIVFVGALVALAWINL